MAFNWCLGHCCIFRELFLLSLFSFSNKFASGIASLGDVLENVDNMNKSMFIPSSMEHKG